jgi:hypothetical protein
MGVASCSIITPTAPAGEARYDPEVMRCSFRLLFAAALALVLALSTFEHTGFMGTVTDDSTSYGSRRTQYAGVFSGFGRIGFGTIESSSNYGNPPSVHTRKFQWMALGNWGPWRYQGTVDPFGLFVPWIYNGSEGHGDGGGAGYSAVTVPFWLIGVALLLPAMAPNALRRATRWLPRRKPVPGRCAACGYDLRATPERCPECGRSAV